MGNKKRQRKNVKRGMIRRLRNGKKPMSLEQKKEQKAKREADKKIQEEIKRKANAKK